MSSRESAAARIVHKTTCALNATGHRGPCTCGAESGVAQTPHEAALDALGIDREEHQRSVDELIKRNEQAAASPSPRWENLSVHMGARRLNYEAHLRDLEVVESGQEANRPGDATNAPA